MKVLISLICLFAVNNVYANKLQQESTQSLKLDVNFILLKQAGDCKSEIGAQFQSTLQLDNDNKIILGGVALNKLDNFRSEISIEANKSVVTYRVRSLIDSIALIERLESNGKRCVNKYYAKL